MSKIGLKGDSKLEEPLGTRESYQAKLVSVGRVPYEGEGFQLGGGH